MPQIRFNDSDQLAALCKAGGDALRLNVLRVLCSDSFGVLELAQIFAIGQSASPPYTPSAAPPARISSHAWPAASRRART